MHNAFVLGILLTSVVWAPIVQCQEPPNTSATPTLSAQNEVDRLVSESVASEKSGQLTKAESQLIEAIKLNGNFKPKAESLVSRLLHIYVLSGQWYEAEKTYETLGQNIYRPNYLALQVAQALISQGNYAEARPILQKFAHASPKQSVDVYDKVMCGNPELERRRVENMLSLCEQRTEKLSDADLKAVAERRDARIKEWRSSAEFLSYPAIYRQ